MALPIEENAGKILSRTEIETRIVHDHHIPQSRRAAEVRRLLQEDPITEASQKKLFMCAFQRRRWRWIPLDTITHKNYKNYRENITKGIEETYRHSQRVDGCCPIKITGAPGSNAPQINGLFYPIPEARRDDGHNVYLREDDNPWANKRWLYMAGAVGARTWRVGNTRYMNERKAIGWLMQTADLSGNPMKVWEMPVNQWKVWDGVDNNGNWVACSTLKIELLKDTQETEIVNLREQIANERKLHKTHTKIKEQYKKVSSILFNKLDKKTKLSLIDTVPELKVLLKYDKLCAVCFADKPTTPCVHFECPGACADCHSGEDGIKDKSKCCACGKEQKLQCPVCFDTYSVDHLEIFKCRHCICLRCYLNSYKVKKKIKKCPTCRAKLPSNFVLS